MDQSMPVLLILLLFFTAGDHPFAAVLTGKRRRSDEETAPIRFRVDRAV